MVSLGHPSRPTTELGGLGMLDWFIGIVIIVAIFVGVISYINE